MTLIHKLKNFIKNKNRESLNLTILPAETFLNNRFDYAEAGVEGDKEIINSMRCGIQHGSYLIMISTFPQGSVYLTTGKREVVTSENSPDGTNRIILENAGEKIEYDTVIRFISDHPAEHMYFLKQNYIFTRRFTPSMSGGRPKDTIENPTKGDFIFIKGQPFNKLEMAKPLINEMENEIEKILVDPKYYSSLKNQDVFNTSISDAYEHIQNKLYW